MNKYMPCQGGKLEFERLWGRGGGGQNTGYRGGKIVARGSNVPPLNETLYIIHVCISAVMI